MGIINKLIIGPIWVNFKAIFIEYITNNKIISEKKLFEHIQTVYETKPLFTAFKRFDQINISQYSVRGSIKNTYYFTSFYYLIQ